MKTENKEKSGSKMRCTWEGFSPQEKTAHRIIHES